MTSVNEIIEFIDNKLRDQLKEYKFKKNDNIGFDLTGDLNTDEIEKEDNSGEEDSNDEEE